MHIVTVSTGRNLWLNDWETSAAQWNYTTHVVGLELTEWSGFATYIELLRDHLAEQPPDELVCITDAYDVVFAGPPGELEEKYHARGTAIVVSAESQCAPQNCRPHGTDGINHPKYPHINTGLVMGYARDLLQMYRWIFEHRDNINGCDQIAVALYKAAHPNVIGLDGNQEMMATVASVDDLIPIADHRFRHVVTGSTPVLVHTPFMYIDLGARSNAVRRHALQNYYGPPPVLYMHGLYRHVRKMSQSKHPVEGYIPLFWTIRVLLWLAVAGVALGTPYLLYAGGTRRLVGGIIAYVVAVGVLGFGMAMLLTEAGLPTNP